MWCLQSSWLESLLDWLYIIWYHLIEDQGGVASSAGSLPLQGNNGDMQDLVFNFLPCWYISICLLRFLLQLCFLASLPSHSSPSGLLSHCLLLFTTSCSPIHDAPSRLHPSTSKQVGRTWHCPRSGTTSTCPPKQQPSTRQMYALTAECLGQCW